MPVYRDKHGNVIEVESRKTSDRDEEHTRWHKSRPDKEAAGGESGDAPGRASGSASDESPTRPAARGIREKDDDRTRVVGRRHGQSDRAESVSTGGAPDDPMDDPLVGWLVVIEGPGRGHALPLGYGRNTVGRNPENRVVLDFGDMQISRLVHTIVTYDPRGRKFFVQHGEGRNLTYINGEAVLNSAELNMSDELIVGDTTLRFIPLCGAEFDWQDQVT